MISTYPVRLLPAIGVPHILEEGLHQPIRRALGFGHRSPDSLHAFFVQAEACTELGKLSDRAGSEIFGVKHDRRQVACYLTDLLRLGRALRNPDMTVVFEASCAHFWLTKALNPSSRTSYFMAPLCKR